MIIYSNTKILRLSDMKYPMYLSNVKMDNPNTQFPASITSENLRMFNYVEVYDTEKPTGDVVEEVFPELREDGNYYKVYTSRDFTEEEISSNLFYKKQEVAMIAKSVYLSNLEVGHLWGEKVLAISEENICIINNIDNEDPESNILIKFEDDTVSSFNKEDYLLFKSEFNRKYYSIRDNFYKFLLSVWGVDNIEDIPEIPLSFTEE